ncbi:MAG: alkane 1-monooxygenase, partial [Planctomycetota bacterium]
LVVLVPVLDRVMGDWRLEAAPDSKRSRGFDLLLELWLPLQLVVLAAALHVVASRALDPWELFSLGLGAGTVTGAGGITVAHELMHRSSRFHRALGELLMATTLYAHFCVEHVHGHHRRVGTREDPATARSGETVYAFLLRSSFGGLVSAWQIEGKRVQKRRDEGRALRPWADRRWRYPAIQYALLAPAGAVAGSAGVLLVLLQAFVAVLLLEIVNYVEHYGLARELRANGRPVRVEPRHSWNSNAGPSSAHLFLLTRHAHHHAEASKPFDRLHALPGSPMLPAGYPTMMLASLVPPLWFRWMDPRVAAALSS